MYYQCWANVGYFFSQHGCVTVLANHRLVPNVVYPGGADDMQMAREWVFHNIGAQKYGRGSPEKVVLLGHSSGGAHIAMNLYAAGEDHWSIQAALSDSKQETPSGHLSYRFSLLLRVSSI